jgi:hypothetical protein
LNRAFEVARLISLEAVASFSRELSRAVGCSRTVKAGVDCATGAGADCATGVDADSAADAGAGCERGVGGIAGCAGGGTGAIAAGIAGAIGAAGCVVRAAGAMAAGAIASGGFAVTGRAARGLDVIGFCAQVLALRTAGFNFANDAAVTVRIVLADLSAAASDAEPVRASMGAMLVFAALANDAVLVKIPAPVTRALRANLLQAAPNASLACNIRDAVLLNAASVKSLRREGSVVIQLGDAAGDSAAFQGAPADQGRTSTADGDSGVATGVDSGSAIFGVGRIGAGASTGAARFIGATNAIGAGDSMGSTTCAFAGSTFAAKGGVIGAATCAATGSAIGAATDDADETIGAETCGVASFGNSMGAAAVGS